MSARHELLATTRENAIHWTSSRAALSSNDFHIRIGETYFYGTPDVRLTSDPGMGRSSLEASWREHDVAMGLSMYFERNGSTWRLIGLRTRNLDGSGWIEYSAAAPDGAPVRGVAGQATLIGTHVFKAADGSAEIRCGECSLTAFVEPPLVTSTSGYAISFRIGLPPGEPVTVGVDPDAGYGVNAVLVAGNPADIVRDQSDFTYEWSAAGPGMVSLDVRSIPYPDGTCAHGALPPCPPINVTVKGVRSGMTRVILEIRRRTTGEVVATNSFTVVVR